jgi:hypothetical protein
MITEDSAIHSNQYDTIFLGFKIGPQSGIEEKVSKNHFFDPFEARFGIPTCS